MFGLAIYNGIQLRFASKRISIIKKVPRDIQGEKTRKDPASSENWPKQLEHNPQKGQNQVSGRVFCWHATPVANDLWRPHVIW